MPNGCSTSYCPSIEGKGRIKPPLNLNMKELILLGTGPSLKDCTWDAEVWCASTVLLMPEVRLDCISKAFAVDDWSVGDIKQSVELAKEHSIPVVSTESYATEPYPLQEIEDEFDSVFLNNTLSYMLALAVYQSYSKLRLFGVDQGPRYEYLANKSYTTFWLGVATGRGIDWELSANCILLEPFIDKIKEKIDTQTWKQIERIYSKWL